jgi:[acyl-carrier-protein] S-malonyltransferase
MGHDLYQREPAARAVFDQADDILGFALSRLCFEGPEDELTETVNQQPALFVTSLAAWQVLKEKGWPDPSFVAGHSLGELSALAAVGSLTFVDGLRLVRRRGEVMAKAGVARPGAMAAILGLDVASVAAACVEAQAAIGRPVQVANDNCPGQVVISGDEQALAHACELARDAGARKVVRLPITIAAHSPLMSDAAAEFALAVRDTAVIVPEVPVIGNVNARPLTTPTAIRAELIEQLTGGVRWTDSMRYLREQDVDTFVEVGPGDVLSGLLKRIDREATRQNFMKAGSAP